MQKKKVLIILALSAVLALSAFMSGCAVQSGTEATMPPSTEGETASDSPTASATQQLPDDDNTATGTSASPSAGVSPSATASAGATGATGSKSPTATGASANNSKYKLDPKEGELLGLLEIPSAGIKEEVTAGTTDAILKKGVGFYMGTLLPGEGGGTLFSAHRDRHFRGLGDAKKGDKIIVTTAKGVFTYIISKTEVVEKNDQQAFQSFSKDTLILSTCYPFNYVGAAPNRYLVFAPLDSFVPAT